MRIDISTHLRQLPWLTTVRDRLRGVVFEDIETNVLDDAARARLPGDFVALGDGHTHYELSGPEDGPVVVLVHGMAIPMFIWDHNVEPLRAAGCRVLRYDLYGRGYSDRPRVDYDLTLFVRQLEELTSALRLATPLSLVGLSMGGAITASYTARHPEHVSRLALVGPLGINTDPPTISKIVKAPLIGEVMFETVGDRVLRARAGGVIKGEGAPPFAEAYFEQLTYAGHKRAMLSTTRHFPMSDLTDTYVAVGKLGIPVALFWGLDDEVLAYESSKDLIRAIPHVAFHPVADGGHCANYDSPEVVNPALVRFLAPTP